MPFARNLEVQASFLTADIVGGLGPWFTGISEEMYLPGTSLARDYDPGNLENKVICVKGLRDILFLKQRVSFH